MTQLEKLEKLNRYLLMDAPQYAEQAKQFGTDEAAQFRLFRALVNLRRPKAAAPEFLALQDEFLQTAIAAKGVTEVRDLAPVRDGLYLWQGDITTLAADAVVNAANSGLTGCYAPNHACIDNAIHTYAGVQLRLACAQLMQEQGHEEPAGQAKLTPAFNLPSRYVIHTVGPIVTGALTESDRALLAACYRSCLSLAEENSCKSIAFCCISTGVFRFPNRAAAQIAVETVERWKRERHTELKVIFNVFKDEDDAIYQELLR